MRPAEPDADDTIRVQPTPPRRRARWPLALAASAVVLAGTAAAAWLLWPHQPAPSPVAEAPAPAPAPAAPPAVAAPAFAIATATEADISRHVAPSLTVFRFADNPRILVLDFASLHEQGRMLNRLAAFVEKAGLPHDRVLSDSELDAAIRANGDTVETFYFGHDYAAAAIRRFFECADGQQIELNPQEERLRALARQEGWLAPDAAAGLISLPTVGSDPQITAAARAAILRHELSHGELFSNPGYAAYVHDFWMNEMTADERAGVRAFLAREEYDVGEEEVMFNEMQAYLMFTRDPMFFTPELAGLTEARLAMLQARFLAGMPDGWLRTLLAGYHAPTAAQ